MKKIILFYKCLIEPGGAERLLIEEYKSLKQMGYSVTVISQKISDINDGQNEEFVLNIAFLGCT